MATSCDQVFKPSTFLKPLMLHSINKEICATDLVARSLSFTLTILRKLLELIPRSEAVFHIDCSEKRRIRHLTTFIFSDVTSVTGQPLLGRSWVFPSSWNRFNALETNIRHISSRLAMSHFRIFLKYKEIIEARFFNML